MSEDESVLELLAVPALQRLTDQDCLERLKSLQSEMDKSASRIVRAAMCSGQLLTALQLRHRGEWGRWSEEHISKPGILPPRTEQRWRAFYAKHKHKNPEDWPKTLTEYDEEAYPAIDGYEIVTGRDVKVASIKRYDTAQTPKERQFLAKYEAMTADEIRALDKSKTMILNRLVNRADAAVKAEEEAAKTKGELVRWIAGSGHLDQAEQGMLGNYSLDYLTALKAKIEDGKASEVRTGTDEGAGGDVEAEEEAENLASERDFESKRRLLLSHGWSESDLDGLDRQGISFRAEFIGGVNRSVVFKDRPYSPGTLPGLLADYGDWLGNPDVAAMTAKQQLDALDRLTALDSVRQDMADLGLLPKDEDDRGQFGAILKNGQVIGKDQGAVPPATLTASASRTTAWKVGTVPTFKAKGRFGVVGQAPANLPAECDVVRVLPGEHTVRFSQNAILLLPHHEDVTAVPHEEDVAAG